MDLTCSIDSVLNEPKYNYDESVKRDLSTTTKALRAMGFKLRSLRRLVTGDLGEGAEKLIPELKSIDLGGKD